ncbi:molybdenum ABC transporter substrate-binding protein [Psychrobacter urativorans]|uniref:Molybdenum ABC transporter substrate-binding protein n=2 Tax=Psychrobacter urativorans TaxID=45610 RepID=A0A0M4U6N5_9GAMM|nr:molybdenum ABC transporter substrate-binding protein [Psychrobacter urativorans]
MQCFTSALNVLLTFSSFTCLALALTACTKESNNTVDQAAINDTPEHTQTIHIAAAANLSDVLPNVIEGYKVYRNLPQQNIEVTYASSGKLYAQIKAGAPYDLFLSANQEFPEKWVKERPTTATAHKPFTYTQGQLSVYSVTKPVSKLTPATLAELLISQKASKITIANPELAPYGESAKSYLQTQNVYDTLNNQKRIIQAENIGQAFQYAHTGSVDYGFVAQSQVIAIKATPEQFYILPADAYPAILQAGVVISDAAVATDFTSYLLSPTGQQYFAKAGYLEVR